MTSAIEYFKEQEKKYLYLIDEYKRLSGKEDGSDLQIEAENAVAEFHNLRRCLACGRVVASNMPHCGLFRGQRPPKMGRPFQVDTCVCGIALCRSAMLLHRQIHKIENTIARKQRRAAVLQTRIDEIESRRRRSMV